MFDQWQRYARRTANLPSVALQVGRNIDQRFLSPIWLRDARETLTQKCDAATFLAAGNPMKLIAVDHADKDFYWLRNGLKICPARPITAY